MRFAIKPGVNFKEKIKFIVIDQKNHKCILITNKKGNKPEEVGSLLNSEFSDTDVCYLDPLSLKKEIQFVWPQVIRDFKERFFEPGGWLHRARLKVNNSHLHLKLESKIAYKTINTPQIINFFQDRFYYYLEESIEVTITNGNFLENIKKKKKNFNKKKSKQSKTIAKSNNSNIVYGPNIKNRKPTHSLNEIKEEKKQVIIKGKIFNLEKRTTRSGKILLILSLTDKKSSICAKLFLDKNSELKQDLSENDWVKLKGNIKFDSYNNELVLMINAIVKVNPEIRVDQASEKRAELHLHTQMSAMDATVEVNNVIKKAADWGHPAIAITDHGVVQSFPEAYEAGEKYGIKIIYGMEAYMVDNGKPIISNPADKVIDNTSFVVFDLETTGLNPRRNEIIEIGAVKICKGKIKDEFSSFVEPENSIPGNITELTGIDNNMVRGAPQIENVLKDFIDFCSDSVLVAHNADFDYGFLRAAGNNTDIEVNNYSVLDTLALSRALLPNLKSHKLSNLAHNLKIKLEGHHRAVNDAQATAEILLKFLSRLKERKIEELKEINQLATDINWKKLNTYHTIILAKNQKGLKSLYNLVSNAHIEHFYRKPRILKSKLIQKRENLIIGSACEAGQLYRAILENKTESEIEKIADFYDYLEIQPLGNNQFLIPDKVDSREELKNINSRIYNLGKKLNKPVVATGDVHFTDPEDKVYREILQAGQGFDNPQDQAPLYFRTTEEMLEEFSYLGQKKAREVVIENPQKISNQTEDEIKPIPEGLFTPEIEGAEEQIRNMTYNRARNMYGQELPDIVEKRLEKELNAIIDNGYAVIYLISHKLVKKSLEDGYLVGSRGSVGSSLVATMCEITEVNPLPPHYRCPECRKVEFINNEGVTVGIDLDDKNCPKCGTKFIKEGFDIPFEVFLGFKGDKVPDIDLNFSGEYQNKIHQETEELFGRDYVFRAGTISTIADRTAYGFVKGYMDDFNLNLKKTEVNRLVKGCTGVRRTTGQHPGGLMIVPRSQDIFDFSPIQHPANDQETDVRTTHFDYHSISGRILKLDLLGHDDPTSLRMLQDLTGVKPDSIPLDDPDTMSIFSSTEVLGVPPEEIDTVVGTLGIPEFGTSFVRQMLVDTKPTTFAELVRISGLSHGTDVWLNNAQNLIKNGTAKLSEVISVRDDIMNYLLEKELEPSKAFWIMEHVRKGKGLTEEEKKAMIEAGVDEWYIDSCKKIKYMFPKAHASAYVMMAFRIAYFKVHYPEAFYTTYFSNKAADFDAHLVSQGYERIRKKRKELKNQDNLTAKDKATLTILQIVIEAMGRGITFGKVDLYKSKTKNFKLDNGKLIPPLICLDGLGESAAQNIADTRKKSEYTSVEDLVNRTGISKTVTEILNIHGALEGLPERNQLSLFQ